MTFVHDDMPIVRDEIVNLSLANETLDQCDIDHAFGLATSPADSSDRVAGYVGETGEPLNPLIQENATVNKDQGL